jgi:hypothetical protein
MKRRTHKPVKRYNPYKPSTWEYKIWERNAIVAALIGSLATPLVLNIVSNDLREGQTGLVVECPDPSTDSTIFPPNKQELGNHDRITELFVACDDLAPKNVRIANPSETPTDTITYYYRTTSDTETPTISVTEERDGSLPSLTIVGDDLNPKFSVHNK